MNSKNNDAFVAALFKIDDFKIDGAVEEKERKLLHRNTENKNYFEKI